MTYYTYALVFWALSYLNRISFAKSKRNKFPTWLLQPILCLGKYYGEVNELSQRAIQSQYRLILLGTL